MANLSFAAMIVFLYGCWTINQARQTGSATHDAVCRLTVLRLSRIELGSFSWSRLMQGHNLFNKMTTAG